MKYIVKLDEPDDLAKWKADANDNWQPSYNNMPSDIKNSVKSSLSKEQGGICCYCERRLDMNDSHIEHFKPQSKYPADSLAYSNMLCSCQSKIDKKEPRHCGILKENWFDKELLVSPFDQTCQKRFAFLGNGEIKPNNDNDPAAVETIKNLGLGIPKLNSLRAKAIEPFLDENLSDNELQQFVSSYLRKDSEGQFGEFWTTVDYLFKKQ